MKLFKAVCRPYFIYRPSQIWRRLKFELQDMRLKFLPEAKQFFPAGVSETFFLKSLHPIRQRRIECWRNTDFKFSW
jgi:hypothetical protein